MAGTESSPDAGSPIGSPSERQRDRADLASSAGRERIQRISSIRYLLREAIGTKVMWAETGANGREVTPDQIAAWAQAFLSAQFPGQDVPLLPSRLEIDETGGTSLQGLDELLSRLVAAASKECGPGPPALTPPSDVPTPEELDTALRRGLVPLDFDGGQIQPIISPRHTLFRLMDDYRYALRSLIAGMAWDRACALHREAPEKEIETHKGNLLIWGYSALCEERDAESEFIQMAEEFHAAATATNALAFAIERDGRKHNGVPLGILLEEKKALYDEQTAALGRAFRPRREIAARCLHDFSCRWLRWLTEKGVLVQDDAAQRSQYVAARLSVEDMTRLAQALQMAGDLARFIVDEGIVAVLRAARKGGDGRLPSLLYAWLVQQGRRDAPKIGPQKLATLLKRQRREPSTDAIEDIKHRLEQAARRYKEPVFLTLH